MLVPYLLAASWSCYYEALSHACYDEALRHTTISAATMRNKATEYEEGKIVLNTHVFVSSGIDNKLKFLE